MSSKDSSSAQCDTDTSEPIMFPLDDNEEMVSRSGGVEEPVTSEDVHEYHRDDDDISEPVQSDPLYSHQSTTPTRSSDDAPMLPRPAESQSRFQLLLKWLFTPCNCLKKNRENQ
ncbi:hypothetical protein J6590_048545 [Homalodisca vitripennis]|nr:hypothetical protein J6590_048545 [Homalodisca vitripennis]